MPVRTTNPSEATPEPGSSVWSCPNLTATVRVNEPDAPVRASPPSKGQPSLASRAGFEVHLHQIGTRPSASSPSDAFVGSNRLDRDGTPSDRSSCGVQPSMQGHRLFQNRVGQARFERRPTILKHRELLVGRRGETPLVPPYILLRFKKAIALPPMRATCRPRLERLRRDPSPLHSIHRAILFGDVVDWWYGASVRSRIVFPDTVTAMISVAQIQGVR